MQNITKNKQHTKHNTTQNKQYNIIPTKSQHKTTQHNTKQTQHNTTHNTYKSNKTKQNKTNRLHVSLIKRIFTYAVCKSNYLDVCVK
jgi:hypothetical protein